MDDFRERLNLLDERAVRLFQKYPLVALAVYLIGFICGGLACWAIS